MIFKRRKINVSYSHMNPTVKWLCAMDILMHRSYGKPSSGIYRRTGNDHLNSFTLRLQHYVIYVNGDTKNLGCNISVVGI